MIYIYIHKKGSFEEFHARNSPWNEVNNYANFSHTWAVARRAAIVVFRQDSRIHWYVAAASCNDQMVAESHDPEVYTTDLW